MGFPATSNHPTNEQEHRSSIWTGPTETECAEKYRDITNLETIVFTAVMILFLLEEWQPSRKYLQVMPPWVHLVVWLVSVGVAVWHAVFEFWAGFCDPDIVMAALKVGLSYVLKIGGSFVSFWHLVEEVEWVRPLPPGRRWYRRRLRWTKDPEPLQFFWRKKKAD
ncbi:unnamed protein product [Zymoseptoria tritici ST99CH_3D7]|uniref:Uncharacterized protein n=1 Tax=Zymoseptoria tritici (strain ST99CH_3D7) TaxID=1276538 RepID=A0A1X7S6Y9_ZYMT9|nr:unnamed protein product [Zymoseptoria tritici ST99CH_3D7]